MRLPRRAYRTLPGDRARPSELDSDSWCDRGRLQLGQK